MDTALISGLGRAGVCLLLTVIAVPVVVGLEAAALICRLMVVASKFVSRKLQIKAKKQDEIRMIVKSQLKSIKDLISKTLSDWQITEQEFKLILEDVEGSHNICFEKRMSKQNSQRLVRKKKKALTEKGRIEAMSTIQKS